MFRAYGSIRVLSVCSFELSATAHGGNQMASQGKMSDGLLEALPDALLGVDPSGVIRLVSPQAVTVFGYGRDDLIGSPFEMLVPGSLRQVQAAHPASQAPVPAGRRRGLIWS